MRVRTIVACVVVGVGLVSVPVVLPDGIGSANPGRVHDNVTHHSARDDVGYEYASAVRVALVESKEDMPSVDRAVGRFVHGIGGDCRMIAAAAPRNPSRWPVEVGITDALLVVAARADVGVATKLGKEVSRLRWAMRGFTRHIRQEIHAANVLDHDKLPELCGDLKTWSRGRFQRVPLMLKRFSEGVEVMSEKGSLLGALRLYGGRRERSMIERLAYTVAKEFRARVLSERMRVFDVVGLRHGSSTFVQTSGDADIG